MSNARRRALRSTVRAMGWFAAAVSALRGVPCGTYRVDILRARRVLPVVADLRGDEKDTCAADQQAGQSETSA